MPSDNIIILSIDCRIKPSTKQLHLTLANKFSPHHQKTLEQLAKSINVKQSCQWMVALYSRDMRFVHYSVGALPGSFALFMTMLSLLTSFSLHCLSNNLLCVSHQLWTVQLVFPFIAWFGQVFQFSSPIFPLFIRFWGPCSSTNLRILMSWCWTPGIFYTLTGHNRLKFATDGWLEAPIELGAGGFFLRITQKKPTNQIPGSNTGEGDLASDVIVDELKHFNVSWWYIF